MNTFKTASVIIGLSLASALTAFAFGFDMPKLQAEFLASPTEIVVAGAWATSTGAAPVEANATFIRCDLSAMSCTASAIATATDAGYAARMVTSQLPITTLSDRQLIATLPLDRCMDETAIDRHTGSTTLTTSTPSAASSDCPRRPTRTAFLVSSPDVSDAPTANPAN